MSISPVTQIPTTKGPSAPLRRRSWFARQSDRIYLGILVFGSLAVLLLILAVVYEMFSQSRLSMHTFGWKFITSDEWNPVTDQFGMKPFILGTLYSSFWALLIAIPVSLGAAIYLTEVAPRWIRSPLAFLIELLAAIPSVVYGLWGVFVLVPWLVKHVEEPISQSPTWGRFFIFDAAPNGNDFLAASLLLAIMVIPIITGIARDIIKAVPNSLREGSYALGATRWETIRRVVLPRAKGGLVGAVILGLGRALGETMAITMVIGNTPEFKLALFNPGYTMSAVIANEFTEAPSLLYRSALMEIGFSLLVIALLVNGLARWLVAWTSRNSGAAA